MGIKPRIRDILLLGLAMLVSVSVAVITVNHVYVKPFLTGNDLQFLWITSPKIHFLESAEDRLFVYTNQELVFLDNPRETFSKVKEKDTFRIFCIGGSTTRGWPFHKTLSYPKILGFMLSDALPCKSVEVINAGFHGSDSFADKFLVNELVGYDPDLIVVNEGRNDLWNFPLHASGNGFILRSHGWMLRNVRLYSWIKALFSSKHFNHAKAARDYADKLPSIDNAGLKAYLLGNLKEMTLQCRRNGCDVILLTQLVHSSENDNAGAVNSLNGYLKEFCSSNGVHLVDVQDELTSSGFKEEEVVIPPPSLHPDYRGYALFARRIVKDMAGHNIIAPKDKWDIQKLQSDGVYIKKCGLRENAVSMTYLRLSMFFDQMGENEAAEYYRQSAKRRFQ
ncbi:MAG: SGNH/GDSL hydrolase family protein [Endomicrobiales bacterium]|nr:SGNH/GDSL hydrolase family protein [Endomicrobiales bacterium]